MTQPRTHTHIHTHKQRTHLAGREHLALVAQPSIANANERPAAAAAHHPRRVVALVHHGVVRSHAASSGRRHHRVGPQPALEALVEHQLRVEASRLVRVPRVGVVMMTMMMLGQCTQTRGGDDDDDAEAEYPDSE